MPYAAGCTPWNKGKSYVIAKRKVYANNGAWKLAMRRLFASACMRCGWDEGPTDTHHIIPHREGGLRTMENGIILCPNCHRLAEVGILSMVEMLTLREAAAEIGERV